MNIYAKSRRIGQLSDGPDRDTMMKARSQLKEDFDAFFREHGEEYRKRANFYLGHGYFEE